MCLLQRHHSMTQYFVRTVLKLLFDLWGGAGCFFKCSTRTTVFLFCYKTITSLFMHERYALFFTTSSRLHSRVKHSFCFRDFYSTWKCSITLCKGWCHMSLEMRLEWYPVVLQHSFLQSCKMIVLRFLALSAFFFGSIHAARKLKKKEEEPWLKVSRGLLPLILLSNWISTLLLP